MSRPSQQAPGVESVLFTKYFECCHVSHFHTQIARVIDEVAANSDACAVRFSLLGTVAPDKTGMGRSFVFGDL